MLTNSQLSKRCLHFPMKLSQCYGIPVKCSVGCCFLGSALYYHIIINTYFDTLAAYYTMIYLFMHSTWSAILHTSVSQWYQAIWGHERTFTANCFYVTFVWEPLTLTILISLGVNKWHLRSLRNEKTPCCQQLYRGD